MQITKITALKQTLNQMDTKLVKVFLPWALRNPRYLRSFLRLLHSLKHTERLRKEAISKGVKVPPFMILSITSQCNLNCKGCYAESVNMLSCKSSAENKQEKPKLNREQWRRIISDASELGVLGFLMAGGEPFLFPGLLELCNEFKDRLFVIATNGTILKESDFEYLKHTSNVAIIVGIDGGKDFTDLRRGQGTYEKATGTIKRLSEMGVLTGISVTITRLNYKYWMESKNLERLISKGVLLAAFLEYIPNTYDYEGEQDNWGGHQREDLMLTKEERAEFHSFVVDYRMNNPIYLIHTPTDEETHGGCIGAGRGFVHVTPEGDLTACPVSSLSTHNLATSTLEEGLSSLLFKEFRESEEIHRTKDESCALLIHSKETEDQSKAFDVYNTSLEKG